MNILLIDGNGFVGQALIKEFKKYNVKVSYISRTQNNSITNEKITWVHGDIFDIENISINEKYDIAIHLIGTIKDKKLYSKLNTKSVAQAINGGFKRYLESKLAGERLVKNSKLDYLIVRPGLMYGKDRLTSYFNILPIKFFSKLGITFFKNVYPLPVEKVAESVVKAILNNTNSTIIEIKDMK